MRVCFVLPGFGRVPIGRSPLYASALSWGGGSRSKRSNMKSWSHGEHVDGMAEREDPFCGTARPR